MAISIEQTGREAGTRRRVNVMRLAILAHRYIGIAVGVVVSAWCLSAFVMMYVQYPEFTDAERVAGLGPLTFETGGAAGARIGDLGYAGSLERLRVEMLAGRPVLRVFGSAGQQVFDFASGRSLNGIRPERAEEISSAFAERMHIDASFSSLGTVGRDQWTVYASYRPHRPLYHFAADDAAGTEWYVSGPTGEVVQITTRAERFWNWIGAVTHWIYFTELREHTAVWAQVVIWLTIVSLFLTVLGLYIGVKQLKRRRSGRWSPYRGAALWHHVVGVAFGVLVLTWLASGLLSMNPWGALEGRSFGAERERLAGGEIDRDEARRALQQLPDARLPSGTVRLDTTLVDGELAWIAARADGTRQRLHATAWRPAPLRAADFERGASRMRPGTPIARQGWLEQGDAYYYGHHQPAELPVYRVVYADGERFYLDATSGTLTAAFDTSRRWYRWLFEALHRGDFAQLVRARPTWDLFMLPLLAAVTLGAVTGTWMGVKRLTRSRRRRMTVNRARTASSSPPSP